MNDEELLEELNEEELKKELINALEELKKALEKKRVNGRTTQICVDRP
jgi:hypothetical protein